MESHLEIIKTCKALSSETRLKILGLFNNKSHSAIEIFRKYNGNYSDSKQRETIYRELEKLVDAGILEKDYISKNKKIIYRNRLSKISIDCRELEIKTEVI